MALEGFQEQLRFDAERQRCEDVNRIAEEHGVPVDAVIEAWHAGAFWGYERGVGDMRELALRAGPEALRLAPRPVVQNAAIPKEETT